MTFVQLGTASTTQLTVGGLHDANGIWGLAEVAQWTATQLACLGSGLLAAIIKSENRPLVGSTVRGEGGSSKF